MYALGARLVFAVQMREMLVGKVIATLGDGGFWYPHVDGQQLGMNGNEVRSSRVGPSLV